MVTLEEIREKVPTAHYAPRENCKYCNGTGFRHKVIPASEHLPAIDGYFPCMCIFVDHAFVDMMQEAMNETIRKIKAGL